MIELDGPQRIDKWLWASRFFKTRALAKSEVLNGRVLLSDQRIKPSQTIRPGDSLRIVRGTDTYIIIVDCLVKSRVSAKLAETLYTETEASREARLAAQQMRKASAISAPVKRPDKRNRRKIIQFKSRNLN